MPLLEISMLEGPFAIMALCGPPIHLLVARVLKYKTLSSLFSSRTPYVGDSGYGSSNHGVPKEGSTTAFASRSSEVAQEERRLGTAEGYRHEEVPMGNIAVKSDVRVDSSREW